MGLIGACVIALRIYFGMGFSFVMFNVVKDVVVFLRTGLSFVRRSFDELLCVVACVLRLYVLLLLLYVMLCNNIIIRSERERFKVLGRSFLFYSVFGIVNKIAESL